MSVFMFTDIEGSTQLMEKHHKAFLKALGIHDAILQSNIGRFGGRIVSHTGDGVFAVFEDGKPNDPLACALEIQKELGRQDWGSIPEVRVRMALHAGAAEKRGDGQTENYFGPTVVRCARLMAVAWGGQILMSPEVSNLCPQPAGAVLQDLGTHVLKDLGEPQTVLGLTHPDLKLNKFPALRSVSLHPHNLPVQSTQFVGRENEIKEISKQLSLPECRLLTLLGPGGSGKTRLSLQVAAESIEKFSDGVYFVPLAPLSSADFMVAAIADALSFSLGNKDNPKVRLLDYLKNKKMLLVMDNFEHLMAGAELLSEILSHAPHIKILVTSRERLKLVEEWVFVLSGMETPETENEGDIYQFSSIQLFLQTARKGFPQFSILKEDLPFVIRLCRLVQGMPLAIMLASAWVKLLSCKEIFEEVTRSLDFLNSSSTNVPERQKSFKAVFEYSWKLLTEEERAVFRKISVFRGGFTKEAALKITGASLPAIFALMDKSLLNRRRDGRYEIHELLRQYAEEKLNEFPEEVQKTMNAYVNFYAGMVSAFENGIYGEKSREVLDTFKVDLENIRGAWNWGINLNLFRSIGKMISSMRLYYNFRGPLDECVKSFEKAVEKFSPLGGEKEVAVILGDLLDAEAFILFGMGSMEKCAEKNEKSIEYLRRVDAPESLTRALQSKTLLETSLGQYEEARETYREIIELCERPVRQDPGTDNSNIGLWDFRRQRGWIILRIGSLDHVEGKYRQSLENVEKAKAVFEQYGDPVGVSYCYENFGKLYIAMGEYDKAHTLLQKGMEASEEIGSTESMVLCLCRLVEVSYLRKEYRFGETFNRKCLEQSKEFGYTYITAVSIRTSGLFAYAEGNYKTAMEKMNESQILFKEIGDKREIAITLMYLGRVSLETGKKQESLNSFKEALKIADEIHSPPVQLRALAGIAGHLALDGKKNEALPILAFVLENEATEYDVKEEVKSVFSKLEIKMPETKSAADSEKEKKEALNSILEWWLNKK